MKIFKRVLLLLLVVLIFAVSAYWYRSRPTQKISYLLALSESEQILVGQLIGDSYRNLYGYSNICSQNGYELKVYPTAYRAAQSAGLTDLNLLLSYDGLTLENAIKIFLAPEDLKQIDVSLTAELNQITTPEKTIAAACKTLDDNAVLVASNVSEESKDLYQGLKLLLVK